MPETETGPSSFDLATTALLRLIATGPAPHRTTTAIGEIVAAWADEPDMTPELMRSRAEALWDGFSTDAATLQEQLSDPDNPGSGTTLALGHRVLAAMNEAVATLAAITGNG